MNTIRTPDSNTRQAWIASLLLATLLSLQAPLGRAENLGPGSGYPGYISFGPSLIVNLASTGSPKFARVDMELYVLTPADGAAVNDNLPAIRDRIITLLGGRDMETLQGTEGREALRAEVRDALRETLQQYAQRPAVEDVFFTGFVMQ